MVFAGFELHAFGNHQIGIALNEQVAAIGPGVDADLRKAVDNGGHAVGFLHAQFINATEYRDALRMSRDEREHGNFVNE